MGGILLPARIMVRRSVCMVRRRRGSSTGPGISESVVYLESQWTQAHAYGRAERA